ncbi:fibronectin type III domain-containing protein [Ruminococcus albus]|uniref:Fibronectin type III domain protein n=1 Tax=Ruminococcus albus (strain ATCC 27210 / DSM 20455 / JCM 14654 / NCDO 2250 / 7) TaxID=697329 RepID=E6UAM3_RUMA7|nr:fibronectin type III domain-containing protein [Ruminococcus albus]ADU22445.1 Fibronectin type III domain protein [Ruminococcus albus 7 = DSM 20455]
MKKKYKRIAAFLCTMLTVASVTLTEIPSGTFTVSASSSKLVAFPGAVGGGKYATGGRGGEVYHVTNLNDSGTGSLRDAVSKSGRIVVFDVSGTINLNSNIVCSSNITIAGQTAPGGSGVTLKNYKFGMGGDNIIVRYLSSRPGPDKATSSGNDAWGGAKGSNSVVDHCSLGWTTDEQWGLYSNNDHYTVQYSVIGPANSWGGHVKGVHGFGLMMGRSNLTFDHNLICHNVSRNFRGKVVGTETADFTNNIIYDWGYQTAYGTIGHVNYVNNTLKAGNSTASGYHYVQVSSDDKFKLYLNGNRILNKDGSYRNREDNNWAAISYNHSDKNRSNTESITPFTILSDNENISTALTCESAASSYDHVIKFAGNGITPDKRTAIDKQCAEETQNGTGSCSGTDPYSSSQSELNTYKIQCGVKYEYPSAVYSKEITDNDNDGMDDSWELARGLDPTDHEDYKGDYCGQGYMNIEYYINDLTVDSFPDGVVELSPSSSDTKYGAVMDTTAKYEITDNTNSSLLANTKTWRLEDCGNSYYRIISADDGRELSSGKQYKFVKHGSGYIIYTKSSDDIQCVDGNGTVWKLTVKAELVSSELFTEFTVLDSAHSSGWSIAKDLSAGALVFGDRDVVYTSIPDSLTGAEYLITACDSKLYDSDLATFRAGKDMTVYIALDNRVSARPVWLSNYTKTGMTIQNNNSVTFDIYQRDIKSGTIVTLGTNGQSSSCVNYTVFAKASVVPEEPEYPEIINIEYSEQYHQIRFTWKPVNGATNYAIAVYLAGKWRIQTQNIPSSSLNYTTPKNLTPGKTYKVAVAAKVNGEWTVNESVKHAITVTVR